jgi:hypothetical protein
MMLTEADLTTLFGNGQRKGNHLLFNCPSHDDHDPSLCIRYGERALLIKCWAGCDFKTIIAAVGLRPEELFYDYTPPGTPRLHRPAMPTVRPVPWREVSKLYLDEALDEHLRADAIADEVTGVDISSWSDEDLEEGWVTLDCGRRRRQRASTFERVAWNISAAGLRQEGKL